MSFVDQVRISSANIFLATPSLTFLPAYLSLSLPFSQRTFLPVLASIEMFGSYISLLPQHILICDWGWNEN